jgi:hypothetical protein
VGKINAAGEEKDVVRGDRATAPAADAGTLQKSKSQPNRQPEADSEEAHCQVEHVARFLAGDHDLVAAVAASTDGKDNPHLEILRLVWWLSVLSMGGK